MDFTGTYPFEGLLQKPFDCDCGRRHNVPIAVVRTGLSVAGIAAACADALEGKNALVLCDAATDDALNNALVKQLEADGWSLVLRRYTADGILVNNEGVVGSAVFAAPAPQRPFGVIAVGGGTVTDLGRFVGSRLGRPFALVMTCPSMDGYASNVAGMMVGGKKKIFKDCRFPAAVLGNSDVMRTAPWDLIKSGFGDMLGKRTALPDWVLARQIKGEHYCAYTAGLMDRASRACVDALPGILRREAAAVDTLTAALCMAGVCMALAEDTRPASGSEHIFSHYLVEGAIAAGRPVPSHGETVGFGTLVSTHLYQYLLQVAKPAAVMAIEDELRGLLPRPEDVHAALEDSRIGASAVRHLGGWEKLPAMINACAGPQKRYTVLRYLADEGLLEEAAAYVMERME